MSDVKKIAKRIIKLKENDLVDLIDSIVAEAVAVKKQEWITEQAAVESNKTTMLGSKLAALETKMNTLLEAKK